MNPSWLPNSPPNGAGSKGFARHESEEAEIPLEDGRGARQPFGRERGGEHAVPRRVGEGATLPFAQLAAARLPQRDVADPCQADGVREAARIEFHQLARGDGRGDRAVSDVVDPVLAETRRVAEAALDLVGEDGGRDEIATARAGGFANRQHGREVVARMGRFLAQVGVVEVQVTNEKSVDERGPFDTRSTAAEE